MRVAIGVDSHKETLAAAVVDELGRPLADRVFANDPVGLLNAAEWMADLSNDRVIGIECSGSYGATLAWLLMDRGETVHEVPPTQTYRERNRRRSAGKSILWTRWRSPAWSPGTTSCLFPNAPV